MLGMRGVENHRGFCGDHEVESKVPNPGRYSFQGFWA